MRLISATVKARRADLSFDLSIFTRAAGFTSSRSCRTASPKQTRSTLRLRFAVARERFFASESRNRVMSRACSVERSRSAFEPRKSAKRSVMRTYRACVDGSVSIDFVSAHVLHHCRTVALESVSALNAKKTSATPCAMISRAASALSLPLRALSAALCHARQISSACFLWGVLVERKTRLFSPDSGSRIV